MNREDLPGRGGAPRDLRRPSCGPWTDCPLTIRTLDLGVDKRSEALGGPAPAACNPALGLRAIRLCLKEPELFRPATARHPARLPLGPVRLMLPMVTNVQEVDAVLGLIAQLAAGPDRGGPGLRPGHARRRHGRGPRRGACAARSLARRMDFLSIGTNDLIQYTLAIDRLDDAVSYLFDPTHPAVLRLIRITIAAGRATDTPVAMCGEMAGDPRFTRLLLGLGLRQFSMQPGALLEIKEVMCGADCAALEVQVAGLMARLDDADPADLRDGWPTASVQYGETERIHAEVSTNC